MQSLGPSGSDTLFFVPLPVNSIFCMFGFPEGSIFTPGSATKLSVNPGMCMSSFCAFCWYMVRDYLVNGGLDVFPHAVDCVEGYGENLSL